MSRAPAAGTSGTDYRDPLLLPELISGWTLCARHTLCSAIGRPVPLGVDPPPSALHARCAEPHLQGCVGQNAAAAVSALLGAWRFAHSDHAAAAGSGLSDALVHPSLRKSRILPLAYSVMSMLWDRSCPSSVRCTWASAYSWQLRNTLFCRLWPVRAT